MNNDPSNQLPAGCFRSEMSADELVVEARQGSAAALDLLVEKLSKHLWGDLNVKRGQRRKLGSNDSSDLVQDTLIRVRNRFGKFDGSTFAEFLRWSRAVLFRRRLEWNRNMANWSSERHQRELWRILKDRISTTHGDPARIAEVSDKAVQIMSAFSRLRSNEQFVIRLHLLNEQTFRQIGELTSRSEDAARKAFHRAIAELKRVYQEYA